MRRPEPRKVIGGYEITSKLGSGSFSTVYLGKHQETGEHVAIKSIKRHKINLNARHQSNLQSEIAIMKDCDHENVVKLKSIENTNKHIYLILEFCAGGDLYKFIKRKNCLPENVCQHFGRQLAAGLKFLRSKNYVHRDLKPQNLLLTKRSYDATLKIADFGFARHMQQHAMAETMCGSPLYMAPEILQAQKYDAKADLWSSGTILYQMIYGVPPFTGANHHKLLQLIKNSKRIRFPPGYRVSAEMKDLLTKLLQREPKKRISFEDFFKHPWLNPPPPDRSPSSTDSRPAQAGQSPLANENLLPPAAIRPVAVANRRHSSPLHPGYAPPSRTAPIGYSRPGNFNLDAPLPPIPDNAPAEEKDDFIHIEQAKPSPGHKPSVQYMRSSPATFATHGTIVVRHKTTLDVVRKRVKHASALGHLADRLTSRDQYGNATVLYIQSCNMYQEVRTAIGKQFPDIAYAATLQVRDGSFPNSQDSAAEQLKGFFQWATYRFSEQIHKAKALIEHLRSSGTSNSNVVGAHVYKVVFDEAMKLGKRGAVDEMQESGDGARIKYIQARELAHFLESEKSASRSDRDALGRFVSFLDTRLSRIQTADVT